MLFLKRVLLYMTLLLGWTQPFLLAFGNDKKAPEPVVQPVEVVETPEPPSFDDLEAINEPLVSGFTTYEIDGYGTIEVPVSHWTVSSSTLSDNLKFTFVDNRSRMYMGYVTDLPDNLDVDGFTVQQAAAVNMVTNTKHNEVYDSGTWSVVDSTSEIDGYNISVYYIVSDTTKSVFWIKVLKDANLSDNDTKEIEESVNKSIDTFSRYYIGESVFEVPSTGVYEGVEKASSKYDFSNYIKQSEGHEVFTDHGGIVKDADISSNWTDFEIIIDGNKLKFPCKYDDIINAGFKHYSKSFNKNSDLGPGESKLSYMINSNGTVIIITLVNGDTQKQKKFKDCVVTGMQMRTSDFVTTSDKIKQLLEKEELSDSDIESIENMMTSETDISMSLSNHQMILAGGVTWGVFRDDLKELYNKNCDMIEAGDKILFIKDSRKMIITIGNISGISAIEFEYKEK